MIEFAQCVGRIYATLQNLIGFFSSARLKHVPLQKFNGAQKHCSRYKTDEQHRAPIIYRINAFNNFDLFMTTKD